MITYLNNPAYVYFWLTISCEKVKMIITEKYHMAQDQ